jgi:tetratricopeptide (TPR) repeat protein
MSSAVDPVTGGLIYCNILWSCRCFADWSRGHQWADGFETWCKANFTGTTGACDLHRAEVLSAKASLAEALIAVDAALSKLPRSEPWALGDAYRVRGDILAARGDVDAAKEDYRSAYAAGWDAEPGNAVLLSEEGDVDGALSALDRVLARVDWFGLQRRGWILSHKARICARAGRTQEARACIELLTSSFDGWPSSAIHALVTEAEAFLTSEEGADRPSAILFLTLARQLWTSIGLEHHAARVRVDLAKQLLARGDRAGALVELACAEEGAKRVGARLLQEAAASLGARARDGLV